MVQIVHEEQLIVRPSGEIDLSNVADLKHAVEEAVNQCPKGFVIDLSDVNYIDSAALQTILAAYQRIHQNGGELTLVATTKNVKEILSLVRLDAFPGIHICENSHCTHHEESEQVNSDQ